MTTTPVLTVVTAGLRSPSTTRTLADELTAAVVARVGDVEVRDIEVRHVEVRDHAHAIMDALLVGFPTGDLARALDDVAAADALIVVSPTFQGSYSGLFKAFADLLGPDQLRGTPVLLAATGGSERHSLVIEHALRPLFAYLQALLVPTGVYAATSDFGGAGSAALTGRIERAAGELVRLLGVAAGPGSSRAASGVSANAAGAARSVDAGGAARSADAGGVALAADDARGASMAGLEGFADVTPFEELLARAAR